MRLDFRPREINHVKGAPAPEDPPDLSQRLLPLFRPEVMEHEGGEHAIEGRIGIWQFIRKALIELDGQPGSFRLASASGERLWIGIEPHDIRTGMKALNQLDQGPGSAADIESSVSRPEISLIEEVRPLPYPHQAASRADRRVAMPNCGPQRAGRFLEWLPLF